LRHQKQHHMVYYMMYRGCQDTIMRTTVNIDDELMKAAQKLTGIK
jgi:Arc/MetJ family transcription regulator